MPISRPLCRAPRLGAALAAAGLLAVAFTGCTPGAALISTPTPTVASPVFASDEEALAAAVAAYEAYAAASQQITDEGGEGPDRIDPFVTPSFAETVHAEFADFREAGNHYRGTITADTESLVEWYQSGNSASASIYLCRDVSRVRVFDPEDKDITPPDRQERVPTQVFVLSKTDSPTTLLVDGIEKWSGDNFC